MLQNVQPKQNLQVFCKKKVTQAQQYKELCSKVVFAATEEETGATLISKYDKPKNKKEGKVVIVSLKKETSSFFLLTKIWVRFIIQT